jgi:outer membrane protein assembly factor BamA
VPLRVTIAPGPVYHFGDVSVTGLQRLRPGYVKNRFTKLEGQVYSPEVLDEKFRALMRSGLFNIIQIRPVAANGDTLNLQISAEEAKSKELGLYVGYGSYVGAIVGASYRERNLFGYGRPITMSAEYTSRSYKAEVSYEDPYLFETDFHLRTRVAALTYDFDGYSKFEFGGRLELERELTKKYKLAAVFTGRQVEVTSEGIAPEFLGQTSYFVSTVGFTHTLDLRTNPFVSPRGLIMDNTFDLAASAIGSQIDFVRSTFRASYYLPFGPPTLTPGVKEDLDKAPVRRFFAQSSLAVGLRIGIIHELGTGDEVDSIPIDERFFNGGSTTVRSFVERDLGPHDRGDPIGGEFFTVFNAEYTFPLWGELQGALFADAGNLLASSEDPGLEDMRYAFGVGLRYKLPIGPIRLDYGINPDPREFEDAGAFHFSFGFAF